MRVLPESYSKMYVGCSIALPRPIAAGALSWHQLLERGKVTRRMPRFLGKGPHWYLLVSAPFQITILQEQTGILQSIELSYVFIYFGFMPMYKFSNTSQVPKMLNLTI